MRPAARKERDSLKIDRHVLIAAGASLALASPAAAQAPGTKPKPAAAATPAPVKAPAPPSVAADPAQEAKLKARVNEYWKQRMTQNLASILPFYEKSFRSSQTPEVFAAEFRRLNRFAPEFLGIDGVRFDTPAKANLHVKLRTRPAVLDGAEIVTSTAETWVLEDGQWYKAAESTLPAI
jgi:hypothetical protein